MKDALQNRLERINVFIKNGYVADVASGLIYSPSRSYTSKTIILRGSTHKKEKYIKLCTKDEAGKIIQVMAHHFIYYIATGKVSDDIEHINKDKSDNRIANLAEVPKSTVKAYKIAKGYTYRKDNKKFRTRLSINHKSISLGNFKTEDEAHDAYVEAKQKLIIEKYNR